MASLLSKLLLLGAAASMVQASSISAWLTDIGPQVILVNETTNQIRYSACNSYDSAKYSYTDGSVFSLLIKPKVGTPVAGAGWWNSKNTIASIWYITEEGSVANGLFNCDMSTGLFLRQGNWVISDGAPSVHSNTGLAAVLLGQDTGYRVYFHDNEGAINELHYTRDTGWSYRGVISQDINSLPAVAAVASGNGNITVVSPRDERNVAATRWNRDETWFRTTLPQPLQNSFATGETIRADIAVNETTPTNFSLPAWDGKTKGIGLSLDSAFTRFLWYIGNDSSLYLAGNQNYTWSLRANQSTDFWPQADQPNADLAVAYDFNSSMVRLYYTVKGQLSEIKYENKTWQAWSTLEAPPPLPTQNNTIPVPTNTAAASDSGLSTGAKAGIGVGVSLGAIALGAIIAVFVLARKRKQRQAFEHPPEQDEGSTTLGADTPVPSYGGSPALARASAAQYEWDQKETPVESPGPEHGVQQLDSTARAEMYAPQPIYELPQHSYSHELVAEPIQPRQ
ncbi:hypothetical protein C8A01DRAFT_33414 [Parachaetomium inaequale]|uniref:Uncharacterized protein n=1 Tax=Parachaetomium inaequale TaxID=2588326 RepID=A0AAN6PPZ2_9PEZI|nr:hypothetical protein C8A01DRAFT_33414 [Parachaetomium inaequale]